MGDVIDDWKKWRAHQLFLKDQAKEPITKGGTMNPAHPAVYLDLPKSAPQTIKEILDILLEEFGFPNQYMKRPSEEEAYNESLAAIESMMEYVIGEDDTIRKDSKGKTDTPPFAKNQLRASQRQRLRSVMGK